MEFNPEMFAALLDLLRHSGVDEFEGFGFKVRFRYQGDPPAILAPVEPEQKSQQGQGFPKTPTLWDNPALWPDGKRPGFPGMK